MPAPENWIPHFLAVPHQRKLRVEQVVKAEGERGDGGGEQDHEAGGRRADHWVQAKLEQQGAHYHASADAKQPCTRELM